MSDFLQKYKRQPKIYIDLPSHGKFYNADIIQDEQYSQIAVFGMTTMDEIMIKTPDALFTGEATASIIKSCIPAIIDPWKLVGYDIDYVLLAIRVATYGETMNVGSSCPNCRQPNESQLDLQHLMGHFVDYPVTGQFTIGDLTVHVNPIDYATNTEFSREHYTLQRQISQIETQSISRMEKDKQLNDLMAQMTNLNLRLAVSYIDRITDNKDEESDKSVILDFIKDHDAEFYNKLKESIKGITDVWDIPRFEATCINEECNKTYRSKINMDYASFFGTRSLDSRNLIL